MSFPRYPTYKDSGVEWIGDVPEHWSVTRVRWLFEIRKRIAGELGFDVFSITQQGFRVKDLNSNEGQVSQDYSKYQFVEVGDFAMNHMDLITGGVDIAQSRGVTSPDYRVFSIRDRLRVYDRYFLYLFQNCLRERIFFAHGQGSSQLGRWRFPTDNFKDFRFPVPPTGEQEAIATFLDLETTKIDTLVAEQEGLVELLREKRQAVVSHAVTKGLNPDAPMRQSGIEWLGKVPDHWPIVPVHRLTRPGTSITYGIVQAGPDVEGGIPYIRTSDMAGNELPTDGYLRTTPEIDRSYARSKVRPNDLVVAIRASLGKGLLVPDHLDGANLTQGTARICPGERLMPRFLYWAFNSGYCQESIRYVAKGTTFLEITLEALRRIPLALPSLPEQAEIIDYVERATGRLDSLIVESEKALALLQDRRAALISAAVTGQIDVRGAA